MHPSPSSRSAPCSSIDAGTKLLLMQPVMRIIDAAPTASSYTDVPSSSTANDGTRFFWADMSIRANVRPITRDAP